MWGLKQDLRAAEGAGFPVDGIKIVMPFGQRLRDGRGQAGPAGRGDGENPHFSGVFFLLGVGMFIQPSLSKAELDLFPWRAS